MTQPKKAATKRKGNPAKQAEALRISQIGDFKKRLGGLMELPSGAVVKLKNPGGLQAFLGKDGANTIPNRLMAVIQESIDKGKAPSMNKFVKDDGSVDPEMFEEMTQMMETVLVRTVVQPEVQPRPTEETVAAWNAANPDDTYDSVEEFEEREDMLFAHEFPDVDKQFIFQWVTGGVKDLESFRQKQLEMLGSVESGASAGSDTK